MIRINLFRNHPFRSGLTTDSVAWGTRSLRSATIIKKNIDAAAGPVIFAALLLVCSLAVGCSSGQTKPEQVKNNQAKTGQPPIVTSPAAPASPTLSADTSAQATPVKPVHKRIVRKTAPTVAYVDQATGVSFRYPRKYSLKTGDAAAEIVSAGTVPMDFVQPGGTALVAVGLPESSYPNSDLATAFFDVSVNKTLNADQCTEFSVPQTDPASTANPAILATAQVAKAPISKLLIGDLELQSSEAATGEAGNAETKANESGSGNRREWARYYHVFRNGGCYEFALKVATAQPVAPTTPETSVHETSVHHVDRDEVFHRLETILATVKINAVPTTETNAEARTASRPATEETPAQ